MSDRSDTVRLPLGSAEEWVGKKPGAKSKKKATSASKKQVDRAVDAFEILWKARAWDEMQAQHFLGLYVVCHRKVYGTDPADLFAAWTGALGAVRATLKHEFGDSPSRMVSFLQWAWGREQQREKQRRNNGGDFRLSWRFLFVRQAAAGNLTDWRTSLARAAQTRSGIKAAQ